MAQETINLPRNTTVASIAEAIIEQNSILKQHFVTGGDTIKIADWDTFRQMVRAKNIGQYFSVGDQITCKRGTDTIAWDIVHIGKDDIGHFATLQTHNVVNNSLMVDNREALFYAQTELPAGNYYFTPVATNVDSGWNAYKTMTLQFTLTKAVPAGGQLCMSTDGTAQKAPTQIITYSSQTSTTPLETVAATAGTTGTDLSTLGTLNHIQKVIYGSNTWEKSAMRQWLTDLDAGTLLHDHILGVRDEVFLTGYVHLSIAQSRRLNVSDSTVRVRDDRLVREFLLVRQEVGCLIERVDGLTGLRIVLGTEDHLGQNF